MPCPACPVLRFLRFLYLAGTETMGFHTQGPLKPFLNSYLPLPGNLIYSLQKGKGAGRWPLFYLEVLPFVLFLLVYLQICAKETFTWPRCFCQLVSWSHFGLISHLQYLRTSNSVPATLTWKSFSQAWWCTPVIPALRRLEAGAPQVWGQPEGHSESLSLKSFSWF